MKPDEWHRITAIFHAALERHPASRDEFLNQACAGDGDLRARVGRLLVAHNEAGSFGAIGAEPTDPSAEQAAPTRGLRSRSGVAQRRSRHPFTALIVLGAVVVFTLMVQAVAVLIADRGAGTEFGWSEAYRDGRWVVSAIDPAGPADGRLQLGDVLTALDGGPPVRVGTTPYRLNLRVGDSYRLTLDRDGEPVEVRLVVAAGPSLLARRIDVVFVSMVWCLVGLFIGLMQPWRPAARLASGAAVLTGIGFLTSKFLRQGPLFHPLHAVLGYHFFSRFPADRPTAGATRWSLAVLYAAGVVPTTLGLWTRWTLLTEGTDGFGELARRHPALFQIRPPLASLVFYASLTLAVLVVARTYRRLHTDDERLRLRWILLGSLVALGPQLLLGLAGMLHVGPVGAPLALTVNTLSVALPISVAYAVVRYQIFDIRVVVRRGVRYLLARRVLTVAVAIPIFALSLTLVRYRNVTIAQYLSETRAWLFWLVAASLALGYRAPIQRWLDRRFFREAYDRERLLTGLLDDVRKVESIGELARVVRDRIEPALHPTAVYVWYRDPRDRVIATTADPELTPSDVPFSDAWLRWLEELGAPRRLGNEGEPLPPGPEARWFEDRGIRLLVPIMDSNDHLVGALLLGEKKADEPYSHGDAQLLDTIAKQLSVVRENLRLKVRVGEEVRVRQDVLARLDQHALELLKECPQCGACFDGALDSCPVDGNALVLSLPVTRLIDGKYRLERRIGTGGMGAVFEARDLRLERVVAVKILQGRSFGRASALRRFHREARAAARLSHPNIVALHDYGSLDGGGAYLVMERVQGVTLRAELERSGPMTPASAAAWFGPILDGVAAAHAAGVIHRDLKPENVIGRRDDSESLVVKVLDLGLAKLQTRNTETTADVTAFGAAIGTPSYMSPEQLAGVAVDQRTDIYAIGVMLAESLAGRRPLPGGDFAESPGRGGGLARSDWTGNQRKLWDLILHCLARDRRNRIGSAVALREELIPLLHAWPPEERLDPGFEPWVDRSPSNSRTPTPD